MSLYKDTDIEPIELIKKKTFGLIYCAVGFCFVFSLVVLGFYTRVFSGGWSDNSQDWGAFGSYFGGVFTPIVTVISTVAVFYTIYLQRRILRETQLFSMETLSKQQKQIDDSNRSHAVITLENHRSRLLKNLEQHVFTLVEECAMIQQTANRENNSQVNSLRYKHGFAFKSDDLAGELSSNRLKINKLNKLMLQLSVEEFEDIKQMNEWFHQRLLAILPYSLDEDFPHDWEELK